MKQIVSDFYLQKSADNFFAQRRKAAKFFFAASHEFLAGGNVATQSGHQFFLSSFQISYCGGSTTRARKTSGYG